MLKISSTLFLKGVLENENGEVNRATLCEALHAIFKKLYVVQLVMWEPLKAFIRET